jgi:hypothetical protein
LSWSSAIEAALLAPSKEASGLAIFESIVCSGGIAFAARTGNANLVSHTRIEFVVVDASHAQTSLATLVALVAESVVIQGLNFGLIVGRALDCS